MLSSENVTQALTTPPSPWTTTRPALCKGGCWAWIGAASVVTRIMPSIGILGFIVQDFG
jgi:hypothetical protein